MAFNHTFPHAYNGYKKTQGEMKERPPRVDPIVSAQIPQKALEDLTERLHRLGISRSQYIRQLVEYDLYSDQLSADESKMR